MKKYSAHYVFPLVSAPLKNGIVVVDDDGFFQELVDTEGHIREIDRLEFHSGILIPGIAKLSVPELFRLQQQLPHLSLNELLNRFSSEQKAGFISGQKASIFLISPLDLPNMKLTAKSKLKKLV